MMKQKTSIAKKSTGQIWKIQHLTSLSNEESKELYFRSSKTNVNSHFIAQVLSNGLNIFLIQNKGKGPPGLAVNPEQDEGIRHEHPPDFIPLGSQKQAGEVCQPEKPMGVKQKNYSGKMTGIRWNVSRFENSLNTEYPMNINRKILNINHF